LLAVLFPSLVRGLFTALGLHIMLLIVVGMIMGT
jgi:hypothetical protein